MEGGSALRGFEREVSFVSSGDLVYWRIRDVCKRGLWKLAALSIASSRNLEWGSFTGDF